MFKRCLFAAALFLIAVFGYARGGERLASYPSKPIRIIIPYAAGGGLDLSVRLLARFAEMELGQNIMVENITKGGNVAGILEGIDAPADGYTLLAWATGLVTDELVIRNATYSHRDVLPVCMFAEAPELIVASREFAEEHGIGTFTELLDHVRANPGTVTIGVGGNWTAHDILRLKMESQAGVKFNRMPFLGGRPAVAAAADGNCNVALPFVSELLGLPNADMVVPMAAAYSSRVPLLPDLPSVAEFGYPDMTQTVWRVLTLPKGTPEGVLGVLTGAFERAVSNPEFVEGAKKLGFTPVFRAGGDLDEFLRKQYDYYFDKTREWGIQADRDG